MISSVFKGIKKVFKKVVKVVKKVAAPVLAIGALVFTGGAALGLAPLAGGWGAAASAVTAKLGATGVLGSALTGAITQAGYGALTGGLISEVSGGSFSQGARAGATVGAVTGGLLSGFSHLRNPQPPNLTGAAQRTGVTVDEAGKVIEGGARSFPLPTRETGGVSASQGGAAQAATGGRGLLSGIGKFAKDNPEITAGLVQGVGTGLLSGAQADAERDMLRERYDQVRANYRGADPGSRYRDVAPGESNQTPTERFDPRSYGSYEYQYNARTGRIERVPVGG